MDHFDVVAVLSTIGSAMGAILIWLWRHSMRLTSVEVNVKNNAENIKNNATRSDTQHAQIMASFARLEDKIDRKADR